MLVDMATKLVDVKSGEIYAIPLFVSDKPRLTRFSKSDLSGPGKEFAFARVVTDLGMGELIIDVLDATGGLDTPLARLVSSKRLFRPVATTSLAIHKKRWLLVGRHPDYDKERDSAFSTIALVLSPFDNPVLWRGGIKRPISVEEARKYEPWTLWGANQIEKRIIEALGQRGDRP